MSSPCRQCGRCCRAISLDQSATQLRELAARESARLHKQPHHPHRTSIQRLIRDVRFIGRHFQPIDRAVATALNPALALPAFDGRSFFRCDQLTAEGACASHATRPYLCAGYPWYHSAPSPALLAVRPCGYESELPAPTRA